MIIPANHFFKVSLFQCRPQLESRLMTRANHTHNFGIPWSEMLDRHGGRSRSTQRCQKVPPYHRFNHPCVWIKQKNGRLVIDQPPFFQIVWPIASGFQPKGQSCPIEPTFKSVQCIFMSDRLTNDREIISILCRHGCKDFFHCIERRFARHKVCDVSFRHNEHSVGSFCT